MYVCMYVCPRVFVMWTFVGLMGAGWIVALKMSAALQEPFGISEHMTCHRMIETFSAGQKSHADATNISKCI